MTEEEYLSRFRKEDALIPVITALIKLCKEFGFTKERILERILSEFSISEETAIRSLEQ